MRMLVFALALCSVLAGCRPESDIERGSVLNQPSTADTSATRKAPETPKRVERKDDGGTGLGYKFFGSKPGVGIDLGGGVIMGFDGSIGFGVGF